MEVDITITITGGGMARIFETMPEGWRITEDATSGPLGYIWINNGKTGKECEYGLLPEWQAPSCFLCKHLALDLALGYICRAKGVTICQRNNRHEINKPRNCGDWNNKQTL